jgi:hypothetical protein
VAGLVLDLGDEDRLAPQRGCPGDPVALRLHPDDLGVRVLGDLADEGLAVFLGHRVARLDPLIGGDDRIEARQAFTGLGVNVGRRGLDRSSVRRVEGACPRVVGLGEVVAVHEHSMAGPGSPRPLWRGEHHNSR